MQSARYSCQILMKLEFSRQIFEKYSNINFHENRPVGIELFHAGGSRDTEWQDRTKLITAFRSFANAPKNEMFTHNVWNEKFRE